MPHHYWGIIRHHMKGMRRSLPKAKHNSLVENDWGVSISSTVIEAAEKRPVPEQINKINSKSREADAAELDKLSASGRELWRRKKKKERWFPGGRYMWSEKKWELLALLNNTVSSALPTTFASWHVHLRVRNAEFLCLICENLHPKGPMSHGHWSGTTHKGRAAFGRMQ